MLSSLLKALLSLRYDIKVTGLENLTQNKGVLIIPNHPAEIDPVIISIMLSSVLPTELAQVRARCSFKPLGGIAQR